MPISEVGSSSELAGIIHDLGLHAGPIWIKVNWTSPHEGMFTTPSILREFLAALPRPVVLVEGHSVGRLLVRIADLPDDDDLFREAVREGDRAFLRSTGMDELLEEPGIGYVNATEQVWAGDVASPGDVAAAVESRFGKLHFEELAGVVPAVLYRGRPQVTLINLARMKVPAEDSGDWSLALKNMFGLIPDPYRIRYHREGLAEAIFDINRVYRSLFKVVDFVEGLDSVVVYSDDGEFKAPWGRYDIVRGGRLLAYGAEPADLELEVAAHFGRDLSGRRLMQLARGIF